MDSKVYDCMKYIAQIVLPALATMISVILSLWNICSAETITAIVGTISAVDAFMGALLKISSDKYNSDEGK